MIKKSFFITLLISFLFSLNSCSIFNRFYPDKSLQYQQVQSQPALVLPEGITSQRIGDAMPVPAISDSLLNVPLPTGLDRPAPLKVGLMRLGVQKRSAGDRHWVFIDKSASHVWPDVDQYFQDRNIPVMTQQAIQGLIESNWLASSNTEDSYISLLLKQSSAQGKNIEEALQEMSAYRVQVQLQPGLQRNTSRLLVLVDTVNKQASTSAISLWPKTSSSLLLEELILDDLAEYLAESLEKTSSVSLLAQQMKREFEVLINEEQEQPFMLINQDFNQSWYVVGKSIREAGLPLYDINRSLSLFYLSSEQDTETGKAFKKKLIDKKFKKILENHHDFQLLLNEEEGGVQVFVKLNDETFADREFSLFILNELKQFSR